MYFKSYILLCFVFLCLKANGQLLNNINFPKEEVQVYSRIIGIHEDVKGYQWIYSDEGVSRYNGHAFERIETLFPGLDSLPSFHCDALTTHNDQVWFGIFGHGLFLIDENGILKPFSAVMKKGSRFNSTRIHQIQFHNDLLLVLGEDGLEIFRQDGNTFIHVPVPTTRLKEVSSFYIHENNLWVTINNDLNLLNTDDLTIEDYSQFLTPFLFEDEDGKLWMAHIGDGTEIMYFDKEQNAFVKTEYQPYKHYKKKRTFQWIAKDKLISCPTIDLFVELAHFDDEKIEHINERISGLEQERFIKQFFRDSKGQTWFFNEELYMIPKESIVHPVFLDSDQEIINDLVVMENFIYTGNRNKGLYKFTIEGKRVAAYNTRNSELADNFITRIVDLGGGRLGLCLMNFFQVYDINRGFEKPIPIPGISHSAFENDRFIWIGGYKSVFKYDKLTKQINRLKLPKTYPNEGNPFNAILKLDTSIYLVSANEGTYEIDIQNDSLDMSQYLWQRLEEKSRFVKYNDASLSPSKK